MPILLNETDSIFSAADYATQGGGYGGASSYAGTLDQRAGWRQIYRRLAHRLGEAKVQNEFSIGDAIREVTAALPAASILVIGSGDAVIPGNVTYTDVAFGRNVHCIADAHDLPFLDGSFDVCVAIAVLEHVADPYRCVSEIMRVLRPGGYVYAETPFMQPVHMGAHDFTRFTHLGHRRLFRYFEERRSGIAGGPAISAGSLIRYAIASMSDRPTLKKWLKLVALLLTFPCRWLDRLYSSKRSAYDSASAFYFFGVLRSQAISDRELLTLYRGS